VTAAVDAALQGFTPGTVDAARVSVALALAQLVDGGSVPAATQLRGVLDDLAVFDNREHLEFLEQIRVPILPEREDTR
jgi:hypothetical protein